ncbi:GTPase family protein [Eikenella halliae]|jgi:yeeP|uniref:GTPase family protein n=1 Tax=Eikenella halliae TaxID=1795832 RepID=UPI0036235FFE
MEKVTPNNSKLSVQEMERLKERIRQRVHELRTYVPKIGVFGVTGVGKSSLCNALFGSDVAAISDVAACTRSPQEILIGENGRGLCLVDVPGVGERIERDEEYFALYKSLMLELDLVIWVIKADDRAYAVAERAYKEIIKPHAERCPTLFVINQVDKINPVREWDDEKNCPGEKQLANIQVKVNEIIKAFDVSTERIQTVSAEAKYNLEAVMDAIVDILPKEKKYAVTREAKEEVVSEKAQTEAEKGIWDTVKEIAGDALEAVREFAIDVVEKGIKKGAKAVISWIFKV